MATVLITGATSGIGWQLAHDYLTQGWQVIACGRNQQQLARLDQLGAKTLCFELESSPPLVAEPLLAAMPTIDCLILNAGICHYVEQGLVSEQVMRQTFTINLLSQIWLLERLLPQLKASDKGQLVFISSAAACLPFVRAEAYGASKVALRYLAQVLHNSLKPFAVQVSWVLLGFIDTPLTQKNNFAMPGLVSVTEASQAIRQGVEQGNAQILFPYWFCRVLTLLERLPCGLKLKLAAYLAAQHKESS